MSLLRSHFDIVVGQCHTNAVLHEHCQAVASDNSSRNTHPETNVRIGPGLAAAIHRQADHPSSRGSRKGANRCTESTDQKKFIVFVRRFSHWAIYHKSGRSPEANDRNITSGINCGTWWGARQAASSSNAPALRPGRRMEPRIGVEPTTY